MSYRKLKADFLFDGFSMRSEEAVLICGSDGTIQAILPEKEAGGDIEHYSGIISPGFVNCHCHLELSHLKGKIPEKLGLVNFVLSVVGQRKQPEVEIQEAMFTAETEMLRAGIVAVGDICNGADSRMVKSKHRLDYYNFIEVLGWAPAIAANRYAFAIETATLFMESGVDEKNISFSPHAPYSVSDELWNLLKPGFNHKTVTIHNQESAAENEYFHHGTGDLNRLYEQMKMDARHFSIPRMSSLSYYLPKLKTASNILLVHNTYTNASDMIRAQQFSDHLYFCFCVNANQYIEDRLPDIPLFIKQNARIVLGTDSVASNHQLSILEEMKTIKKIYPETPTAQMLLWASSNGARALSFEGKLGDFSPGKKPAVLLIEKLDQGEIGARSTCRRIL
jgi:cytosine/adenosine deaminase-related metal-dependent hydrolase